jgi:hypothetical protein
MKVRFDYPEFSGNHSEFEMDVEVLPRIGETLLIPAALLPNGTSYCGSRPFLDFEDWHDDEKTPYLPVKVANVLHRFGSDSRQKIEVWIEQTRD